MADLPDDAHAPARVSLFLTPIALGLAVAFVAAFYWATIPELDLRARGFPFATLLLALIGIGIPAAGFWRNRRLLALARPKVRARAATILVCEAAVLLVALLIFANMTAGGEEQGRPLERVRALTNEAAGPRNLIEQRAAKLGTLSGAGEGVKFDSIAHRGEAILGKDGGIVLYDSELRVLAALVPAYRARVVDWALYGFPAAAFPEHWRTSPESTLTRDATGSPIDHSQELLKVATSLQHEISQVAKQKGTLTAVTSARTLPASGLVDFGYVDTDGRFALYSDRYGVFLVFEPAMRSDGRVDWRCRSYPQEAAVPGCASSLN